MIDAQGVAGAEPGEVLAGAPVPVGGEAQRLALELELEQHGLGGRQRDPQPPAPAAGAAAADGELDAVGRMRHDARRHHALGDLELLGRDDALRELDELVADLAVGAPEPERADEPAPPAAHVDGARQLRDLNLQRLAFEDEGAGQRRGLDRHASRFFAGGPPRQRFT